MNEYNKLNQRHGSWEEELNTDFIWKGRYDNGIKIGIWREYRSGILFEWRFYNEKGLLTWRKTLHKEKVIYTNYSNPTYKHSEDNL